MRFSEKYGFKPIKTIIQKESIDTELRNVLWNTLKIFYWERAYYYSGVGYSSCLLSYNDNKHLQTICHRLWMSFFKEPLDTLSDNWEKVLPKIRHFFFGCEWYEVYDFIQFIAEKFPDKQINISFMNACNKLLKREVSAYRFVNGEIAPIVSDEEIECIEESLKSREKPVRDHLNRSIQLLSDRKSPDYRNSIKESISAVEALTKRVTESDSGTLGKLLSELESKKGLHPALKGAFSKLYGYTSDANGIRHALTEDSNVSFEEAKFMLVACSAFINYVTSMLEK